MAPSIWQLLIILAIILLLFGAKRLKNIGSDLGSAIKGFKQSVKEKEEEQTETASRLEKGEVIEGKVTSKEKEKV